MIETILLGVLPPVSALLGVLITQRYQSRQRESEERRWYAGFLLGRKVDALSNLHAALVDCFFTMTLYGNRPPSTLEEFMEKVHSKEDAYLQAKVKAAIYLDDEADKKMNSALGAFRQASRAIWLRVTKKEGQREDQTDALDWKLLNNTYKDAHVCLRDTLNPVVPDYVGKRK